MGWISFENWFSDFFFPVMGISKYLIGKVLGWKPKYLGG